MKFRHKSLSLLALSTALMGFSRPAMPPELSFDKVNESIGAVTSKVLPTVEHLTKLDVKFYPNSDVNLTSAALRVVLGFDKAYFAPTTPFEFKFVLGFAQLGQLLDDPSKIELTGSGEVATDAMALIRQVANDALKGGPPAGDGDNESARLAYQAMTALAVAQNVGDLVTPFENIKQALTLYEQDETAKKIGEALVIESKKDSQGVVKVVLVKISKPVDLNKIDYSVQKASIEFRSAKIIPSVTVRASTDRRSLEQLKGNVYKTLLEIQAQDDKAITQLTKMITDYVEQARDSIVNGKDGGLGRLFRY